MKKRCYIWMLFLVFSCVKQTKVLDWNADFSKKNGVVFYKGQIYTGGIHDFYENGVVASEVFYKNGVKDGLSKKWYVDGTLGESRLYKNGIKSGVHKGWWFNKKSKFVYNFNAEGLLTGVLKEWYENGQLYKEFHYKKGREVGTQKMWKITGEYRANYVIMDGEKYGLIGSKKCDKVN